MQPRWNLRHLLRVFAAYFSWWFVLGASGSTFNIPRAAMLLVDKSSGSMRIYYDGQTNFQYTLWASSNGLDWNSVLTNMATAPRMTYTDIQATNRAMRIYRAASLKTGFLYQGSFTGADAGGFMMLVRTSNVAVFLGYNTAAAALGGERAGGIAVTADGDFCARLIRGGNGCGTLNGTAVSGNFTNSAGGRGTFSGHQKSNNGPFRFSAGYYRGTYTGSCNGNLEAMVAADGTMLLYQVDPATSDNDAGMDVLAGNGSFYVETPKGQHFSGTLNSVNFTISGSFIHGCDGSGFGNFTLTRSEKVN